MVGGGRVRCKWSSPRRFTLPTTNNLHTAIEQQRYQERSMAGVLVGTTASERVSHRLLIYAEASWLSWLP